MPSRKVAWLCLAALLACTYIPRAACATTAPPGVDLKWIDGTTPLAVRTVERCAALTPSGSLTSPCDSTAPPLTTMHLVFSDEFTIPSRNLSVAAGDSKWSAEEIWCSGTGDMQVYRPEMVSVSNTSLILTIDRDTPGRTVPTPAGYLPDPSGQNPKGIPPPLYSMWNQPITGTPYAANATSFKSGMVQSWNKFCFTGGYIEAAFEFPGSPDVPGYWPAFWLMGNNARACHKWSTDGWWPYSYDTCGGEWWTAKQTDAKPQAVSACADPPGVDRTLWGFRPGQGRGAPELDILEYRVAWDDAAQAFWPQSSVTMQSAPPLPNGTTWTGGPGQIFPSVANSGMVTGLTKWKGNYTSDTDSETYRPGNEYQDSLSAYVNYDKTGFGQRQYKVGMHWEPGEFVRWYVDDHFVYEINKDALRGQTNAAGETTGPRLIPKEAMYVILNLAMSDSFTNGLISAGYLDQLAFPASMKVDYVRVYQEETKINVGCSPPSYETEAYIACNPEKFIFRDEDRVLIKEECMGTWSCHLDFNKRYDGGDLATVNNVTDVKACCKACQDYVGCGAFSYNQSTLACFLKNETGWTRTDEADWMSGTATPPVCVLEKESSYSGGDLTGTNATATVSSAPECCKRCRDTPGCGAFTHVPMLPGLGPNCFLKNATGWVIEAPAVKGTTSGRIGPRSTLQACNLREDVVLEGGDAAGTDGNYLAAAADSPAHCCQICKGVATCAAFSYIPGGNLTCFLKESSGWTQKAASVPGTVSGSLGDGGLPDVPIDTRTCTTRDAVRLEGGDLKAPDGNLLTAPSADPGACCEICKEAAGCGAYSWQGSTCFLKAADGWVPRKVVGVNVTSGALGSVIIPDPVDDNTCTLREDFHFYGGDMLSGGALFTAAAGDPGGCCAICAGVAGCGAFSYDVTAGMCYMKAAGASWNAVPQNKWVSGVVASGAGALRAGAGVAVVLAAAVLQLLL